ncbi:hypothetical protein FB567DRAFT_547526 [Paraphoma chrysanthemicola]|uniref:2EXR domain-containing protein n=1 Tax=Paraphoma chrysanthemicola TaxID=798071 RepID=A0A8K0W082_9PLEO|nr:hypothetical protein FB567DRAFT_547526 [Paraphoma chrysanthemicola]
MDIDSDDDGTDVTSSDTDVADSPVPDLLYSTGRDLDIFHLFPKLEAKHRNRICLLALSAPRTRFLEVYGYTHFNIAPKIRYVPPLPTLFNTSRELRQLSIAHEGGELIRFADDLPKIKFYFNFDRDIIFLSSRFMKGQNTTETFRLREFTSLFPLSVTSRLCRILVTYSGMDSYERIGPMFRPLINLDIFYLGMMDWWSGKTVKRLLRKGVPAPDAMAHKIESIVKKTEAEETDDDEESREDWMGRIMKRQARRIVECEVRLDE